MAATADAQVAHEAAVGLRTMIRERLELADQPDAVAIATALAEDLPSAMLREVVRVALPEYIRHTMRDYRREALRTPPTGSQKWQDVADAYAEHGDNLFRVPVAIAPNANKWLGDCTVDDLLAAASNHDDIAARNEARAEQYRRLASMLRTSRKTTVSKLNPKRVRSVFDA